MPGLGTRNENITYLGMFEGMLVREVLEGTENATKRTKKNGKEVWEIHFNILGGNFVNIRVKQDNEDRMYWEFTIEWEGMDFILSVGYTSVAARGVLSRLKNMDFSKIIEFKTYWIEGDDDIYRAFLTPYINDQKVVPFYTREEPKDLPPSVEKIINNQKQMDSTAQMEFYQKQVVEEILPKMREAHPLSEAAVQESEKSPFTEEEGLGTDTDMEQAIIPESEPGDPGPTNPADEPPPF